MLRRIVFGFLIFLGVVALPVVMIAQGAEEQIVREEKSVVIRGVKEVWRLVWEGSPATICGFNDIAMSATCPCSGWAYGEYGKLVLVRSRGGREIERMDLRPLFDKNEDPVEEKAIGSALLQRWPIEEVDDMRREDEGDPTLIEAIKRRPAPVIMKFADYDRDGHTAAFLLQVETRPCLKHRFVAVGVTANNPHLHALTTLDHPDAPLVMPYEAWRALLTRPGPTVVPTWACGDHGSQERTELVVSANKGTIRAKDREYSCPTDGEAEKLLNEMVK